MSSLFAAVCLADRFPLGFCLLYLWVRDEKVPHDGLKRLRVRGGVDGIYRRNDHAGIRAPRREAAIAANDAHDGRAGGFGVLQRSDEIGTDVFFEISAADG